MDIFYKNNVLEFFKKLAERYSSLKQLSKKDMQHIFNSAIELLEMPLPSTDLIPYFIQGQIVSKILMNIFNDDRLTREDRELISPYYEKIPPFYKHISSNYYLKYRILGAQGYYPNLELRRGDCHYTIINQTPVLITKNKYSSESQYLNDSEIGWISRNEVKISTSVLLTPAVGIVDFYFNDYNSFEINYAVIKDIPPSLRIPFLSELMYFHNRFTPLNRLFYRREPIPDVTNYYFEKFKDVQNIFESIYDSFSIRNELLLRTSTHLIKAVMLWYNQNFGQEAISNVFYALEGSLHLLQKKHGNTSRRINLAFLEKVFLAQFERGEELFDFIKEGYEKRIELVHPETDYGSKWNPYIVTEDFYDYFEICRRLLNYILIERYVNEY